LRFFALPFPFCIANTNSGFYQPSKHTFLTFSTRTYVFRFSSGFSPFCSLANGHINMAAFDRMAAIVGAFTKHMQAMKAAPAPSSGEYEHFCRHMQQTTKLGEAGK